MISTATDTIRRKFLVVSGAVGLAGVLAGCLTGNGGADTPTVTGADVTVTQDGTATVTVSATSVTRLSIAAPSDEAIDLLGFNHATIEPSPDTVLESLPPTWVWDSTVREVSVTLPVSAPDDIAPGTYRFTIKATGGTGDETAEAPLTVQVTSGNTTDE